MWTRRLSLLLSLIAASSSNGYLTGQVPHAKQIQFLKKMTVDICEAKPGELSNHQLSQAPDLMYAWSHTRHSNKECALAVESLVKRVIDERHAGNDKADLTVEDYNCLLEGWARSGLGEAAAERCEQILEAMQERGPRPNQSSFKAVLMAWRQASGSTNNYGPLRAQRILEWMIQLYSTGENKLALPDADCFDTVMLAWSRSGHKQAPAQTEHILGAMERLYERTGLCKIKPRTTSFNAVLVAWSKSNDPAAANRATAILSFMELLANQGDLTVAPDSASFNIVMGAFARTKDPLVAAKKAHAFVKHAEETYRRQAHETPHVVPDTILYNTAIGLWAKANTSGAYRKARSILERQVALYEDGCERCKPDVYGYTSVIASCAAEPGSKRERAKAFSVALATYQELRTLEEGPNHVSYGSMLKACARLLFPSSPVRRNWVRKIFQHAVEAGYVGDMVVSRLREAATPDIFKELMQGHGRKDLPAEWNCNVNETNEYRRKKSSSKRRRAEV